MKRHNTLFGLVGVALCAGAPTASAGPSESFWILPAGSFEDPASWNGPVPDDTVTAVFEIEAPGPFVFFNADELSSRAIIRDGEVEFSLFSFIPEGTVSRYYDLMSPSFNTPSLVVAENPGDDASLRIRFGFLSARSVVLGMALGSTGLIDFFAGKFGDAGLSCEFQLHVGGEGQGQIVIDQAVIVTAGEAVLGAGQGSFGEVTVTESGSALDVSGTVTVGKQGQGVLTIGDQADVTSAGAVIGQQPGSQGDVVLTGQGSTWTMDGPLDVGFQGNGSLTVTGGAAVFTHGFGVIGSLPEPKSQPLTGGIGDVLISGPASLWLVDGELFVGLQWIGTLNILDGATVTSEAGIVGLTPESGIEANVEGPGSVWSNIGDLTVLFDSLLRIADGAVVIAQLVDVFSDAELEADGTILGDLESDGTIRVGDPIGVLDVDGAFMTSGELLVDLDEPVPGEFDAVAVTGEASLGGILSVSLVGGSMPQPGDSFQILTAENVNGTFGTVNLPALPPNVAWHVGYNVDSVELLVTTLGDLDGDGIVGITDFLALLGSWGPCPAPPAQCPADLDGDGMVGITDMLLLLSLWS